jgi:hypothetical protein
MCRTGSARALSSSPACTGSSLARHEESTPPIANPAIRSPAVVASRWRSKRAAASIALMTAAGLTLATVAAWFFVLRDTEEPVSVRDVVETFRQGRGTGRQGMSPVRDGVYVYATVGYEKTDALTGVTHRYPRSSTMTVTEHECGVRMRWDVLKGRSTEWVYCVTPAGWELRSQDERHTFFGRTERTTYTCSDTPIRPVRAHVGQRWRVSCSTDAAEERGTVRVAGRESFALSGGPVATGLRRDAGLGILYDTEPITKAANLLQRGEAVLVLGEYSKPSMRTYPVRLLDGIAELPAGPAVLARLCRAPIVPFTVLPRAPRRWRIEIEPALDPPSRNGGVRAEHVLLQELADRWTVSLRTHAEHWAAVYPLTWRA